MPANERKSVVRVGGVEIEGLSGLGAVAGIAEEILVGSPSGAESLRLGIVAEFALEDGKVVSKSTDVLDVEFVEGKM